MGAFGITGGFYPDFNMGRSPLNIPRLYANYEQLTNPIYYSDDLGDHFVPATGLGATSYQPSLTVRDADTSTVFCGTNSGVYKSTDHGANFSPSGLTGAVWSLLGTRTREVYAGREGLGIYVSTDECITWGPMNTGIETQVPLDLCYGAVTTDFFCGTRGRGVKRYSLEIAGVADPVKRLSPRSAPNPFHETSTLQFEVPLRGTISVRIADSGGRAVVSRQVDGGQGLMTWTWDGCDDTGRVVPNGTYY